jgi:RNA polymerase sigma-70 factor (ECF subfamily)
MTTPQPHRSDRAGPANLDVEHGWVAGIRAGDSAAFEQLFRAYNRQLYHFALKLSAQPDEAEEAVQGVFVTLWERRASWSVQGSIRVYLFTAVRNRIFQQLRRSRTRERLRGDVLAFRSRFLAEDARMPDARVQERDFAAALNQAIAALPLRTREAFLLSREHGLTYEETAATMGISAKTVMTHIGRALTALRKAMGPFLGLLFLVR